jgi:hypothetical protein
MGSGMSVLLDRQPTRGGDVWEAVSRLEVGRLPRYRRGRGNRIFFERPTPELVADAVRTLAAQSWDGDAIRAHTASFSEACFVERIRAIAGIGGDG